MDAGETIRDRDHRRGSGRPLDRVPPGQHGRSFVILDASERVGDPWRRRWDSLRLYSPAKYDGLPGMRFPARRASFPRRTRWGTTSSRTRRCSSFPCARRMAVDALAKEGDRYVVSAGGETFEADNVVVATGVMQKPFVPSFAPSSTPA